MKRFIKSIIIFLIVFIPSYTILIFIWGIIMPAFLKPNLNFNRGVGLMNTRIKELQLLENVDILIFGSSLACRGIDTRILKKYGFNAFNLGSSSQTPVQTKVLLERYLDKLSPKTIIYVINPDDLISDGVESSIDIISNDGFGFDYLKMAFKVNHIKVYNTLIYSLIREILKLDELYFEPIKQGDDTYIAGGFLERNLSYFRKVKYDKQNWKFKNVQIKEFIGIVELIKKNNIHLIFINPPVTNCFYQSHVNNKEFDSIFKPYGNYYDFNNNKLFDDSLHFYDPFHLNAKGVDIFDSLLIKKVLMN